MIPQTPEQLGIRMLPVDDWELIRQRVQAEPRHESGRRLTNWDVLMARIVGKRTADSDLFRDVVRECRTRSA